MAEESTKKPKRRTERIGKYEILDHIATGGMGVVYQARDVDLQRLVALKLLPAAMAKQKNILIRFEREARAAARLRHENIVTIFDVGEDNGLHYIAFEFVEGTDLQDYISRNCRIDPEEARQIIIQAARALGHAHEQGIVHRDIKPSNFLLMRKDKRLIVKLSDFGLAIRHEDETDFRITRDKTTVGTVDYMSPEQARDSRAVDIRSDIYSLGCTFYHMLGGEAPFARGTLPERIVQHMQSPLPDVRKLNKSVPLYLVAIIERMMAKNPEARYQTPAELLHDLENPDQVVGEENGLPVSVKLARRGRKRPIDPTLILDKGAPADEVEAAPPASVGKTTMPAPAPVEKDDENVEEADETPGRSDDDDDEPVEPPLPPRERPARPSSGGSLLWMYVTGGTIAVLVLVLVLALLFGGKPPPPKKDPDPVKPPEPPTPVIIPESKDKDDKPKKLAIDTAAHKMTVAVPAWPVMDTLPQKADRAGLRKCNYGPFSEFPRAPKEAMVLRVSRLAADGANEHRTLADALAATKPNQFAIIEIHDNGPLYVPLLPAVSRRNVLIRGGAGFRPLVVWDVPRRAASEKPPSSLGVFSQGKLMLEGIDFAMRWSEDAPVAVFDLPDSDFHACDCTFSLAGRAGKGIALVRRRAATETPVARVASRTWLRRCYLRGADATLLDLRSSPAEMLVEDSLIVGYQAPLFDLFGRDEDAFALFCVRSTLIAGQTMLRWQSSTAKGGGAPIQVHVLDSILSRDDAIAPMGDLVHLAGATDLTKMKWRADNAVYAGWKRLLASNQTNVGGTDIEGWHRQWTYSTGDRALLDTWPASPPSGLEEQPPELFLPGQAPVAYAALSASGSTGCAIGRLPPTPGPWLERTFEPRVVPIIPAADAEAPPIAAATDGFYHGERLDLNKIDLGAHLANVLQNAVPAPRVVLRLSGQGVRTTSPVRVKGIRHLVLYFEPPKFTDRPLTLEASDKNVKERAPIIEMSGGHLELRGARIQLSAASVLPTIVRLNAADLTLTRCWLQGPLTRRADGFDALITSVNPGGQTTTLLARESVLASSKLLMRAQGNVALKARNNVLFSLGDGILFDADGASEPQLHLFDHNTWTAGHSLFRASGGAADQAAAPLRLHVSHNAFMFPFGEDVERTALVRGAEALTARDQFSWRGQYNVYDPRMRAYFARAEKANLTAQALRDWQAVWGQMGEQNALSMTPAFVAKTIRPETVTGSTLPEHLERLALPGQLRGDPTQNPPGADLRILRFFK